MSAQTTPPKLDRKCWMILETLEKSSLQTGSVSAPYAARLVDLPKLCDQGFDDAWRYLVGAGLVEFRLPIRNGSRWNFPARNGDAAFKTPDLDFLLQRGRDCVAARQKPEESVLSDQPDRPPPKAVTTLVNLVSQGSSPQVRLTDAGRDAVVAKRLEPQASAEDEREIANGECIRVANLLKTRPSTDENYIDHRDPPFERLHEGKDNESNAVQGKAGKNKKKRKRSPFSYAPDKIMQRLRAAGAKLHKPKGRWLIALTELERVAPHTAKRVKDAMECGCW